MKTIYLIALLITTTLSSAHALTLEDKMMFVDFYRDQIQLAKEFPEQQTVYAIFVDITGDGKLEALATSISSYYEDGWGWSVYQQVATGWQKVKAGERLDADREYGSNVYARPGEITKLITYDGKPELVILRQVYDRLTESGLGSLDITRYWIDQDGHAHQEKVENLEHLLAYQGAHRDKLIQSLDTLEVEVFNKSGRKE